MQFRKAFAAVPAVCFALVVTLFAGAAHNPAASVTAARPFQDRQHLIFWKGTPQELEVYKIFGRQDGPTVMILGGIQGDEPGGFLSADLYADLALKRGNLIVVPRANFRSIVMSHRGPEGDMNRKFGSDAPDDAERDVVEIIKSLMAESDLFLNLHDGSGFYRPTFENEMANPNRYGQCVIADAAVYEYEPGGRIIELGKYAEEVVARVNEEIETPLHKFHFFNMETVREDSKYKEQRRSATYYALTRLGIPAYGIETSKQLPSLEMKIHQHNLAVNAFLELFGVEVEQPRISLEKPVLGYLVISVNENLPLAVAAGQTLLVSPGDTIEVVHVGANYERGISVEIQGSCGLNNVYRPMAVQKPTAIVVRKDNSVLGKILVDLLPAGENGPKLTGEARIKPPRAATPATLDMLPGSVVVAAAARSAQPAAVARPAGIPASTSGEASPPAVPGPAAVSAPPEGGGTVSGFLVEVDGKPEGIQPGGRLTVLRGARVRLVALRSDGPLPQGMVMNLRGFVPKNKGPHNDGEDRGATADTARDMRPGFSEGKKGEVYAINAELGKDVLASCFLRILPLALDSVTVRIDGEIRTMALGSRTPIKPGTRVELLEVTLKHGAALDSPRFTLAGRQFPAKLPQILTMRDIAINLAVFNGDDLAGKVTWIPE